MNLLNEREKTHGDYSLVAAVSQALKSALRLGPYDELPSVHRESLEMICVKMARIVCGNHYEYDHPTDIAGYANLIIKNCVVPPGSSPIQEPSDEPDYTDSDYYIPRSGLPR
jgi:hypothetical protein